MTRLLDNHHFKTVTRPVITGTPSLTTHALTIAGGGLALAGNDRLTITVSSGSPLVIMPGALTTNTATSLVADVTSLVGKTITAVTITYPRYPFTVTKTGLSIAVS